MYPLVFNVAYLYTKNTSHQADLHLHNTPFKYYLGC